MEAQVEQLWNTYLDRGMCKDLIIREIIKIAKERGYPLGKVMQLINKLRLGQPLVEVLPQKQLSAYAGCQQDDEGNTIDPYTLQPIPEEYLISVYEGNPLQRYCFDIRSIAKDIASGHSNNPLTRTPYSAEILHEANAYIAKAQTIIQVGNTNISVLFDSVFDVIVEVLRTQDLLPALSKINPFYNGVSLYTLPLESEFIAKDNRGIASNDTIELYPFANTLEQALSLKKMFEYCIKNRQGVADTLFHELGFLLKVPPTFMDENGQEFMLDPEATVYTTIKKVYQHMGGYEVAKKYNLVLEDGTPLYALDMEKKVSEAIPSLEIRYVYYENNDDDEFEEMKYHLHQYAFVNEDDDFIRALANHPENTLLTVSDDVLAVTEDNNYTLTDVIEYLSLLVNKDILQIKYGAIIGSITFNKETTSKVIRSVILRFVNDKDKLHGAVNLFYGIVADINKYVFWREIYDLTQNQDTTIAYIQSITYKSSSEDLRTLLNGGTITNTDLLVQIDDVEFFYRHYKGDVKFLSAFLISDTRVCKYVVQNEAPLILFEALSIGRRHDEVISQYIEDIINRLSEDDIRVIFEKVLRREHIADKNLISKRLPQDILDNTKYYVYPRILQFLLESPNFRQYKEALLAYEKFYAHDGYIMTSISDNIGEALLIKLIMELYKETGSLFFYKIALDNIIKEEEELYANDLFIQPTYKNFKVVRNSSVRSRALFYKFSRMTKNDVIKLLCLYKPENSTNIIEELIEYFNLNKEDAKQVLECNYSFYIVLSFMVADLVTFTDIEPYLRDTNKRSLLIEYNRKTTGKFNHNKEAITKGLS